MGGCYSKNKYTMGDEAPTKKGKKKTEEEIKAENNGNLNASPNKLLDDKSIPFIDRCSGTLGDRSSIMEEDEKQEGNEAKADDKGFKETVDDILSAELKRINEDKVDKLKAENENIEYKREVKVTSTRTVTVKSSDDPEGTTTTKTVVLESSSDKPDKSAEEIFDEMKLRAKEHMENADNVEETVDQDGVKVTKYTVNQESQEDGVERKLHVTRVVTVSEKVVEEKDEESEQKAPKNFLDQFREDHQIHAVDFMRIFRQYDKDKSGYLDMKEMRGFLEDLLKSKGQDSGCDTVKFYLDEIMKDADIDGDKKMELAELANLLPVEQNFLNKFPRRETRTKAELEAIFNHYDKDNSGTIQGTELEALLRDMFTQEQQEGLIDESISLDDAQLREYAALVRELYDIEEDGSLSREDISVLLSKF